jgi:hypothetical protein
MISRKLIAILALLAMPVLLLAAAPSRGASGVTGPIASEGDTPAKSTHRADDHNVAGSESRDELPGLQKHRTSLSLTGGSDGKWMLQPAETWSPLTRDPAQTLWILSANRQHPSHDGDRHPATGPPAI